MPTTEVTDLKLPGVSFYHRTGKWQARISTDGVRRHLGYFDDQQSAHAAYLEAKGDVAASSPASTHVGPKRRIHAHPVRADTPLPQSLLEVLFVKDFLSAFDSDDPDDMGAFGPAATRCCQIAREENVQPWVVSEVFAAEPYATDGYSQYGYDRLQDHDVVVRRVRLLKERGLVDRVSEVVDRALRAGDCVSFETAVAELSAADFV